MRILKVGLAEGWPIFSKDILKDKDSNLLVCMLRLSYNSMV